MGAVARGDGIAGIEHDLAFKRRAVILADLRQCRIGYRDKQDVAKGDRLIDRAGFRKLTEAGNQIFQFFRMA